ncbi:MAG: hypothetical protein IJE42_03415 [Bacteroidaceae bacterium]|nr:hypothetical protein [Bacteroidales bacterium]MBQ2877971.1 hypothetical protein [Bacteroidaceae bacterium]
MKNFIYVAVLALVMTACGANGSKSNAEAAACDTIVATDVVPATATDVLPVALPGDSGKVATEVVPAE